MSRRIYPHVFAPAFPSAAAFKQATNAERLRASYASALLKVLERQAAEGTPDERLMDKIEQVLGCAAVEQPKGGA